MNHYVRFSISNILFAAPIDEIKEVARPKNIITKDTKRGNLIGFFELRKKKIPLFDLPKLLHITSSDRFEVIVCDVHKKRIGFKVDSVSGIIETEHCLQFPDLTQPKEYFTGIIKEGDTLVQVISFKRIVSGRRLRTLEDTGH